MISTPTLSQDFRLFPLNNTELSELPKKFNPTTYYDT